MALLRNRKRGSISTSVLTVVLWAAATGSATYAQTVDEYQLKAAFVFNFARFVEWPAEEFHDAEEPIRICIFGQSPFGRALEDAVRGKTVAGRPLAVASATQVRDICKCQMLFIGAAEQKRLPAVLSALTPAGVLTIGESAGFAEAGGIVNLKLENARIRLEVNVDAAERAKLRISSKLLSLARIVK